MHMHHARSAREKATPSGIKFRDKKIRERGVNHEIHENIMPRKFGAIW